MRVNMLHYQSPSSIRLEEYMVHYCQVDGSSSSSSTTSSYPSTWEKNGTDP